MLKIHKPNKHKLLLIPITSILSISVLLGFSALIYTSELSYAETVTYPEKETRDMSHITYMQEISPEICQNSELNKQYTLIDSRDEKTYTVARIKNQTNDESNCWMTQNLAIIDKTISFADSDIEEGDFAIPESDITNFTYANQNQPKAYYDNTFGGFYNWYTTTAGSGNDSIDGDGDNAPNSICPKGWKLPTSGNDTDNVFYNLANGLSVNQIIDAPYLFLKGGRINGSSTQNVSSHGYYWSSTANGRLTAYYLYYATAISPSGYSNRFIGASVRCVATGKGSILNNIEITINPTISLDVTSEVEVKKGESNPSTTNFDIKVASNQPYKVQINSASSNLASSTVSTTIPSRSGALNTATDGWGIKLSSDTSYKAITSTPTTFYTASGAEVKTIPFTVGISTSPDLPNGEYSTEITVTAVQN